MSIIKHVTLQKIVAHDFRYDPRIIARHKASNTVQNITKLWVNIYPKTHTFYSTENDKKLSLPVGSLRLQNFDLQ